MKTFRFFVLTTWCLWGLIALFIFLNGMANGDMDHVRKGFAWTCLAIFTGAGLWSATIDEDC